MIVEQVEQTPTTPDVQITISGQEAQHLHSILMTIIWDNEHPIHDFAENLGLALSRDGGVKFDDTVEYEFNDADDELVFSDKDKF